MKEVLQTIFVLQLILVQGAHADGKLLTSEDVLKSFPICEISSSLGPWCKSNSNNEEKVFTPSKIEGAVPSIISNKRLEIVTSDWNYTFIIENGVVGRATVRFIDDGRLPAYLTETEYNIEWDSELKTWVLKGETLIYISGSQEEKQDEGSYHAFSEYIPFL